MKVLFCFESCLRYQTAKHFPINGRLIHPSVDRDCMKVTITTEASFLEEVATTITTDVWWLQQQQPIREAATTITTDASVVTTTTTVTYTRSTSLFRM